MRLSAFVGYIGAAMFVLVGCEHLNFGRGEQAPVKAPTCFADAQSLEQKKFGVEAGLEQRVKTTLGGVLQLEATAKQLDSRLTALCDNLAREIGSVASGPTGVGGDPAAAAEAQANSTDGASESAGGQNAESPTAAQDETSSGAGESSGNAAPVEAKDGVVAEAEAACRTAADRLQAFKTKRNVTLVVDTQPFSCGVRLDDYAACARRCDASLPAGTLDVRCEEEQQRGRCSGKCSGSCAELNAPDCAARCQGECNGGCNKGFHGKCGGRCVGTCDMADVNGKCAGTCDGKCLSDAAGTCDGKCTGKCVGACVAASQAKICDGTCRGSCDATMVAAVCSQVYPPAEMSAECVAACSAELTGKLQCSVDHVAISVIHAEAESDGLKVRNALRSRLREILEIGDGMREPLDSASVRTADVLETLTGEIQSSPDAKNAVGPCLAEASERRARVAVLFETFSELSEILLGASRN